MDIYRISCATWEGANGFLHTNDCFWNAHFCISKLKRCEDRSPLLPLNPQKKVKISYQLFQLLRFDPKPSPKSLHVGWIKFWNSEILKSSCFRLTSLHEFSSTTQTRISCFNVLTANVFPLQLNLSCELLQPGNLQCRQMAKGQSKSNCHPVRTSCNLLIYKDSNPDQRVWLLHELHRCALRKAATRAGLNWPLTNMAELVRSTFALILHARAITATATAVEWPKIYFHPTHYLC